MLGVRTLRVRANLFHRGLFFACLVFELSGVRSTVVRRVRTIGFFFHRFFRVWNLGLLSRKLCLFQCFSKVHRFFFIAFFNKKKAFVFSYGSELFLSRTLCSLFLFLSRLVYRFKKFIAFLLSLAMI